MTEEIGWDEALKTSGFITLEEEKEKVLVITNWKFEQRPSDAAIAAGKIELIAEVVEEDGKAVEETKFTTTSKRLKTKLRPILESKNSGDKVKVSILKVGDKFNTQYSIKEIKKGV